MFLCHVRLSKLLLVLIILVYLLVGFILLVVFLIAYYVSKDSLERFEPHFQKGAEFGESVYIGWVVVLFSVNNVTNESLCEAIAILVKRIVILTKPKLSKRSYHIVNLIFRVKGNANWQFLLDS